MENAGAAPSGTMASNNKMEATAMAGENYGSRHRNQYPEWERNERQEWERDERPEPEDPYVEHALRQYLEAKYPIHEFSDAREYEQFMEKRSEEYYERLNHPGDLRETWMVDVDHAAKYNRRSDQVLAYVIKDAAEKVWREDDVDVSDFRALEQWMKDKYHEKRHDDDRPEFVRAIDEEHRRRLSSAILDG